MPEQHRRREIHGHLAISRTEAARIAGPHPAYARSYRPAERSACGQSPRPLTGSVVEVIDAARDALVISNA